MSTLLGKKNKIRRLFTGLLLGISISISAQYYPIRVDISVMPPYTSALSDYIHTPNKIVATLTNVGIDNPGMDVFLRGNITSDGGIEIKTSGSYKPASPIHVPAGMSYTLTAQDIADMFDINKLDVKGIDLKEIMNGAGLPEDNYQICIRAYDYSTNQPISNEEPLGCSNYFMITNLEPPIFTMPFCGDTLSTAPIQNIMVSWTIPAGATGAQYKFEMIEIPEGIHMNPNNAFQSGGLPVILEETTPVNIINITADKALLIPGYTYAFRVQAFDPFNNLSFRNDGYSEVCYFIRKADDTQNSGGNSFSNLEDNIQDLADEFEYVPTTIISGRLLAKFPDNPNEQNVLPGNFGQQEVIEVDPDILNQGTDISGSSLNQGGNENSAQTGDFGYSYNLVSETGSSISSNLSSNRKSFGGMALVSENDIASGFSVKEREPFYYFENEEEIVNVKPLANMQVRLVARFAVGGPGPNLVTSQQGAVEYRDPATGELIQGLTDLNGNARSGMDVLNVVLATATTDENGNYAFNFNTDFYTGYSVVRTIGPGHYEQDKYQVNPLEKLGWQMDEIFTGEDFVSLGETNQYTDIISQNQFDMNMGISAEITQQYQNMPGQQGQIGGPQSSEGMQTYSYTPGEESYNTAYICLKIEVVNEKFCSPDIDIFAMPGDMLEVPVQVAKLKTYNLTVKPIASNDDCQLLDKAKPMDNINVHIYRKMEDVNNEVPMIIDYEGQRLKTQSINEEEAIKDIVIDTTKEDGSVLIKNLVKHAYFSPQYFIEISARNFKVSEDAYEFTAYNYKTVYDEIKTDNQTDATYKTYGSHAVYNRFYQVPDEVTLVQTMVPNDPEIKARIMANTNFQNIQLKDTRIQLYNQPDQNTTYGSDIGFLLGTITNDDLTVERDSLCSELGFISFKDLPVTCVNDMPKGPFRRILVTHPAYVPVCRPTGDAPAWNLSMGSLKDIKDINMEPARLQKGFVVDEDGVPVSAFVKSEHSPFYNTIDTTILGKSRAFFAIPFTFLNENHILVQPKSSQYFETDTVTKFVNNKYFSAIVYKRLHRPVILVKGPGGSPISGATIVLGEQKAQTTNNNGRTDFKFASPGDQFIIKITPPAGYAPIQKSINIPDTKHDTLFTFVLEQARSIHGTVTEKESNAPVEGAVIYTELENTDGTILYLEATTGQNGSYILNGIPKSYSQIEVFAVRKGNNPSYVGDSKTITFTTSLTMMPQNTPYNFQLRRMDDWDLSSIWGYPVTVSALRQVKNKPDEFWIDGYFYNPPVAEGITLQQNDLKLGFEYLRVKKSASGKISPINGTIPLDVNKIPLYINQTFTGILYNYKKLPYGNSGLSLNTNGQHEIIKENSKTALQGMLKLNLSTFEFAYKFGGELFAGNHELGNKIEAFSKTYVNNITATIGTNIQASGQQQPVAHLQTNDIVSSNFTSNENTVTVNDDLLSSFPKRYEIFSLDFNYQPVPIEGYEVFSFPAKSKPNGAYLSQQKIWIPTILQTDIPLCNTCQNLNLNLYAGNIVITKDDINLIELPNDTLQFEIENWRVVNQKDWEFDKNEEAIILEEARIITGKGIDVKIKGLKIRYTSMGEGKIDVSNGALTLGGIARININNDLEPVFNYDETGHYRISFVGKTSVNKPAGTVQQLPAMANGDRIKFESIGLMSNGNDILTINQKIRFHNVMDMTIDQIVSGDGYFDLIGTPDLGLPDFIRGEAKMHYSKKNGSISAEILPFSASIEPPGYVTFQFADEGQELVKNKFTTYGDIIVSPGAYNDNRAFSFKAKLTRTNNDCSISLEDIEGNTVQDFKVGKNVIKVFEGSMKPINNYTDWSLFTFKGNTSQIDGLNKPGSNNVLDFTVNGDIEASSSSLQVSKIDVGLGEMSLTYDFDKNRLHGTLEINNVQLGYAYLNNGSLSIFFDNNGYYLAGRADARILQLIPVNCGFIIGNSSYVAPNDANMVTASFHNSYKPTINNVHGFYWVGEYRAINIQKKTPVKLLKLDIQAGLGQYYEGYFHPDSNRVEIGGYIYGDAWGGISTKFCNAGVGVYIHGRARGSYYLDSKELELNACTDGGIKVGVCGIGKSFDFHVEATGYYDGEFHLDRDTGWSPCP